MNNLFLVIALVVFIIFLFASIWMRYRMKVSKARFAFTVVSSMVTCLIVSLSAMSTTLPTAIASKIFVFLNLGPVESNIPIYAVLPISVFSLFLIYRFSSSAIKSWEAPARVSEINLSERYLENNIMALSTEQVRLLITRQNDPIASDALVNWKEKQVDLPKPIETKDLLRDMFTTAFREVRIADNGWRDDGKYWVGEVYTTRIEESQPLLALIFDVVPTKEEINSRLSKLKNAQDELSDAKCYALYRTTDSDELPNEVVEVDGIFVTPFSSRQLILMGIDLRNYARELVKSFEETPAGNTDATLLSSYVELDVVEAGLNEQALPISKMLNTWLLSDNNSHIALTGEYGQGKSTALLKFCYDWAKKFLSTDDIGERVPLLIELRGKSPSETDPLTFLSSWCARYGLNPQQVFNLIKSGDATIIFEGFDELRNAGRAYYRHQHFNALWRFAYPKTKVVFTGRPNFFLDQEEANRTLRSQFTRVLGGDAHTIVWRLRKLNVEQIKDARRSYEPETSKGIIESVAKDVDFFDIVSRPSMLPVVATIWTKIAELQSHGATLTSAILIELYIQAAFSRKEAELERDRIDLDAPRDSRYLVLPKEARELLTVCIAWRMSGLGLKNTIPRNDISEMIREIYDYLFSIAKAENVVPEIAEGLIQFERKYSEDTLAERVEAITTEVCSAGLLVPDAAGGATNLRFPHKQFFEYLIAKAIAISSNEDIFNAAKLIQKSSSDQRFIARLINEPNSVIYLAECIGPNFSKFVSRAQRLRFYLTTVFLSFLYFFNKFLQSTILFFYKNKLSSERLLEFFLKPSTNRFEQDSVRRINEKVSRLAVVFTGGATLIGFGFNALISTEIGFFGVERPINVFSLIGGVVTGLAFAQVTINTLPKQTESFSIIVSYLRANWKEAGQYADSSLQELRLTAKSLKKGEVFFPIETPDRVSDYSRFLHPAKEFGRETL